jgi:hypothetical protein
MEQYGTRLLEIVRLGRFVPWPLMFEFVQSPLCRSTGTVYSQFIESLVLYRPSISRSDLNAR